MAALAARAHGSSIPGTFPWLDLRASKSLSGKVWLPLSHRLARSGRWRRRAWHMAGLPPGLACRARALVGVHACRRAGRGVDVS
jgi:hypothetical protein